MSSILVKYEGLSTTSLPIIGFCAMQRADWENICQDFLIIFSADASVLFKAAENLFVSYSCFNNWRADFVLENITAEEMLMYQAHFDEFPQSTGFGFGLMIIDPSQVVSNHLSYETA